MYQIKLRIDWRCLLWVTTGSPAWASECPKLGDKRKSIYASEITSCSNSGYPDTSEGAYPTLSPNSSSSTDMVFVVSFAKGVFEYFVDACSTSPAARLDAALASSLGSNSNTVPAPLHVR